MLARWHSQTERESLSVGRLEGARDAIAGPGGVDVARSTVLHRRRRLTRNNSALPTRRKIVFPRVGRSICRPATAATRTDGRCVPTSTEHAHCYRHLVVGSDVRRRVHGVRGRG